MVFLGELGELGVLGSDERRNLIRETLPRVFEEKLSVGEAFNAYKNAGVGIRRADFNSLYWENAPRILQAQRVAGLGDESLITRDVLGHSNYSFDTEYRFIGNVVYVDPVTDEVTEREFFIDTNDIGTFQDIKDYFMDAFIKRYKELAPYATDVVITRGYYTK